MQRDAGGIGSSVVNWPAAAGLDGDSKNLKKVGGCVVHLPCAAETKMRRKVENWLRLMAGSAVAALDFFERNPKIKVPPILDQ